MTAYRMNIFAKGRRGTAIYHAKTIEADGDEVAKKIASDAYIQYTLSESQAGSKHPPSFYELLDGDRVAYSSSPIKSVLIAFRNLILFRSN